MAITAPSGSFVWILADKVVEWWEGGWAGGRDDELRNAVLFTSQLATLIPRAAAVKDM